MGNNMNIMNNMINNKNNNMVNYMNNNMNNMNMRAMNNKMNNNVMNNMNMKTMNNNMNNNMYNMNMNNNMNNMNMKTINYNINNNMYNLNNNLNNMKIKTMNNNMYNMNVNNNMNMKTMNNNINNINNINNMNSNNPSFNAQKAFIQKKLNNENITGNKKYNTYNNAYGNNMMQNYNQNNMNFQNMNIFQNNNMFPNPSINNKNSNNNKNQNNNGNNILINNDNDNANDNNNEFIPKTTISKKKKIEILIDYMVKPRGLENVGATCYMNATLQCFYHVRPLTENLVNDDKINKSLEITNAYRDVVVDLTCCKNKKKFKSDRNQFLMTGENINFIKPDKFKDKISEKNPQFKGVQANDSKDLIIFLLENMDAELTKRNNKSKVSPFIGANVEYLKKENFKKSHNSIFAELFFGFQKTSLICKSCGKGEESYGIFNFLVFPLEKTYNSLNKNSNNFNNRFNMNNNFVNQFRPLTCININKNKKGKRKLNLNDCFTEYFKPEILSGENNIYCNTCKKLQEAKNETEIYLAPHVLILILNRGRGNIFECDVDFPHKLNLNKFIKNPNSPKIFNLIGVISHIGKSSMEGHFIAYCKHFDETWYLFNDSIVNKVGEEDIKIGTPYILFYQNEEIS